VNSADEWAFFAETVFTTLAERLTSVTTSSHTHLNVSVKFNTGKHANTAHVYILNDPPGTTPPDGYHGNDRRWQSKHGQSPRSYLWKTEDCVPVPGARFWGSVIIIFVYLPTYILLWEGPSQPWKCKSLLFSPAVVKQSAVCPGGNPYVESPARAVGGRELWGRIKTPQTRGVKKAAAEKEIAMLLEVSTTPYRHPHKTSFPPIAYSEWYSMMTSVCMYHALKFTTSLRLRPRSKRKVFTVYKPSLNNHNCTKKKKKKKTKTNKKQIHQTQRKQKNSRLFYL
jgi:hypothetical protein